MDPLLLTLIVSIIVAGVFAFVEKDGWEVRRKYFFKTFLYFFLPVLLVGWFMRIFPR